MVLIGIWRPSASRWIEWPLRGLIMLLSLSGADRTSKPERFGKVRLTGAHSLVCFGQHPRGTLSFDSPLSPGFPLPLATQCIRASLAHASSLVPPQRGGRFPDDIPLRRPSAVKVKPFGLLRKPWQRAPERFPV